MAKERAIALEALVVETAAGADDVGGGLHHDAEMLAGEGDGGEDGEIRVAFAATRATMLRDVQKCLGSHVVAEAPRLCRKRIAARDDADKHARAECCTTRAPIAACSTRHLFAAAHHLAQRPHHIYVAAGVMVSRDERCAHHDVVFRAVHVAGGERHEAFHDGDGIRRCFVQADTHDAVDARRVAIVANVVPFRAAHVVGEAAVADGAFHFDGSSKVLQRRAADDAFVHSDGGFWVQRNSFTGLR